MVYLSKIYTRAGDDGMTQLGDGTSLPKHHLRVASYGTCDELSSVLGIAIVTMAGVQGGEGDSEAVSWLKTIQNDLFDVGSDLCVPGEAGDKLRITEGYVKRLEGWIDSVNANLEPLHSFVLPGGSASAAWLHLGRTTCRRTERCVSELAAAEEEGRVNAEVLRYLNRLSDLLFVMARAANDGGKDDVLWVPGKNR
ncbi:Cob(I)yrinic acid a,c-diamide adenosyltransferase [Planctomycetes bacterium Poly30]|uniref:Corrinoid adenosyltransferase n=1 Tax=Saltatorellus ferox TaxID=2528018 RepID=A0A518EXU6_9BACT|nr:Cob(I)yrinic acid a,c-diamide adenosyltransferase [Planctomycetes bacterium Poly30]